MSSEAQIASTYSRRLILLLAWFVAPCAAALNFQINYMIVPFACRSGHPAVLFISPVISFSVAVFGFLTAARLWKAGGGAWPDEDSSPAAQLRFAGMFGMLFSGVAGALILIQSLPVLLMNPCVE